MTLTFDPRRTVDSAAKALSANWIEVGRSCAGCTERQVVLLATQIKCNRLTRGSTNSHHLEYSANWRRCGKLTVHLPPTQPKPPKTEKSWPNPTQPNLWVNPTHGQLWGDSLGAAQMRQVVVLATQIRLSRKPPARLPACSSPMYSRLVVVAVVVVCGRCTSSS